MDIIPSWLTATTIGEQQSYDGMAYSNVMLRLGEVQRIIYPEDKGSLSKFFIEYDVLVSHYENNVFVSKMYENCIMASSMAGLADKVSWTLRADPSGAVRNHASGGRKVGQGSKVLIQCLNGNRTGSIIISGLRDTQDLTDKTGTKEKGHNFHFNFNGIDFAINKDGEMTMQYQGKTTADGKVSSDVDKVAPGTTVGINKDGNFKVSTKDNKQSVTIDHKNHQINIVADEAYTVKVKDVKIDASGSIAIADKNGTTIKGSGVKVGAATDAWMKGSSYRSAQSQLHSQMQAGIQQAAAALPLPLAGVAIGLLQVVAAISAFEAKSSTYLSKKNKTD